MLVCPSQKKYWLNGAIQLDGLTASSFAEERVHEEDFLALTAKILGVPQTDVKVLFVADLAEFADANSAADSRAPHRRLGTAAAVSSGGRSAEAKDTVVRRRAPAKYAFKVMPPWESVAGI